MPTIDLHLHTHFSDGELSPVDILSHAHTRGIKEFAITDHNIIHENPPEFFEEISKQNLSFIQGIEVSSFSKTMLLSFHILGYSSKFDVTKINTTLQPTIEGYNKRAGAIIVHLNKKYPDLKLDFDTLRHLKPGLCIDRNLIASFLQKHHQGLVSIDDCVKEAYVEENSDWMIDPAEAIQLIKKSGGIAVLAHPGRLSVSEKFHEILEYLVSSGLDGIEAYYPHHSKETTNALKDIAREYGLIITGGSDWHGPNYSKDIHLGQEVTDSEHAIFKERLLMPDYHSL